MSTSTHCPNLVYVYSEWKASRSTEIWTLSYTKVPLKRKPLGDLVPNGTLKPSKKLKISQTAVPSTPPCSHPTEPSTSLPVPNRLVPSSTSSTLPPPPGTFKQPEVEYKEVRKGKSRRQRVSACDLPGLPKYDPLRIPFEPHKAQVSK